MSTKILIVGSCVSRDIFNYDADSTFEISAYYARSSFASLFAPVATADEYSHTLQSKFQANIVKADLQNTFSSSLKDIRFDILLIDFIDERFSIALEDNGGIFTLSNELISAGFKDITENIKIIKSQTDDFYELWEKGWVKFINHIKSMDRLEDVFIHKTFWSPETLQGNDYSSMFHKEQIVAANNFLQRLYSRIALDLPAHQFIEPTPQLLCGADDHKWGISPFHYIDDYYKFMLEKLKKIASKFIKLETETFYLSPTVRANNADRDLESSLHYAQLIKHESDQSLDASLFKGNAKSTVTENGLSFLFSGDGDNHQIRFEIPEKFSANGLSIRFKISDWASLRYLAIGYMSGENYHHVKIVHPAHNNWIDFSIGYSDLAFGIQNNWQVPSTEPVSDVKLYFKGRPLPEGSSLEIEYISCWKQREGSPSWLVQLNKRNTAEDVSRRLPEAFVESIYGYLEKCFRNSDLQVDSFLQNGTCPLYGNKNLPWKSDYKLPETFQDVGTYRFSWHALHPAAMLMIYARNNDSITALFSAREFVNNWLEQSYFSDDIDRKFAWYDHGTAERLLSFILMWDIGLKYGFDSRFMSRLRGAIFKHSQLLSSEMFYASHQNSRYHNHAWFQDMALLAAALAMPEMPCAEKWSSIALTRLEDQLEKLIIRDGGYAVFIENSIGYHQGVQRLIAFAGELVLLSGQESTIPKVADELIKFSDLLRYPDNRAPAQGDTFRRCNPLSIPNIKPYERSTFTLLPNAGYAIIKGNHEEHGFMLSLFSTSLCKTHKHEDNLSITLFMGGIEWLIDPSFYSHEYAKPVESYLRSAWAHNNLAIRDANYTIDPGHSKIYGECVDASFSIQGNHTAYEGYHVSRDISGSMEKLDFSITDFFSGDVSAEAYTLFHCGEGVIATSTESGVTLSHLGSKKMINILSDAKHSIITGWDEGRINNAVSGLGFMEKNDTTIISFEVNLNTKTKFIITAT